MSAKKTRRGFSIWNLKNAKLYIDNAVINTVNKSWAPSTVYTRWINWVRAAPYKSVTFEGAGSSFGINVYVNGELEL